MTLKRTDSFKKRLGQLGIDSFLVMSPLNRRYLSGFTGTSGVLLITAKQNFLFTDFRYIEQATLQAPAYQIIKHGFPLTKTLEEIIKRLPIESMGIESDFVTYKQYEELQANLPFINILPQENLIESLRLVKDDEEKSNIRKAAKIADMAFLHVVDIIKPGMKEIEVALELEFFMRSKGASAVSFETIVASGNRSALPHGVASEKVIQSGDFVTMDFGCIYNGYCSDMTRTIVIGKPTDKQKEVYNIVLEAQLKGLNTIRAGLAANEVDAKSRAYITSRGYGEYFGHGLGHGVGLNVHENPSLSPRDNTEILTNMVITVEPGIYLSNWGGVRIEDLVVVSDTGCENLTSATKELIIIR
ncbi:MAG: M24 family metallopeptidase [Peptococcales bacterium]|jgi:Xaa-Pro aminopeptidase